MLLKMLAAGVLAVPPPRACDNKPVLMVVTGPTHDGARLRAYAQKIMESGLYDRLGGYYLNAPRPIATFEGTPPPNLTTLVVRFPCLANAEAFWYSKAYQEMIRPMRLTIFAIRSASWRITRAALSTAAWSPRRRRISSA